MLLALRRALLKTETGAADAIVINDRCLLRVEGEQRIVVGSGVPLLHFVAGDRMAEAYATVILVEQGWADQNDVARAFRCSPRTVRRYQRRYDAGAWSAWATPPAIRKGIRVGRRAIALSLPRFGGR